MPERGPDMPEHRPDRSSGMQDEKMDAMMNPQLSSPDPWPEAPQLPGPIIMDQRWTDALFLHWRVPEATAAAFMPPE